MSRHWDADGGYTLVEMLVTIIMLTLITGSITAVVITSLKHQNSLQVRGSVLASVRSSLEDIDRDIRSANPLCYATGTEITMLESKETSPVQTPVIVDYKVQGTKLVYTQYNVVSTVVPPATAPANYTCSVAKTTGTLTSTTYYTELTPIRSQRTVISNLTGSTSTIFALPGAPTFNTCPAPVNVPNALTQAAAMAIQELTVSVSVQPSTLSSPVSASDCGTYLRNYAVATS
ncbi:MAG TPA: hypothetical protein VG899_13620 [Mycobacteriales bacterium]|nr:hypothetical protein [Mycobacteriales bacterium]